jgi:hypothetical protein
MAEYYVFTKNRDETQGWMDGCIVWWRPEGNGYTYDLNLAGIFTDEHKEKGYPSPDTCQYVPRELVEANSYSPRLAFWGRARTDDALPLFKLLHPEVKRQ